MSRDPKYDILFEPIKLGPVTAKNRFYQVPHCSGMGYAKPHTAAAMRGSKAEGGWAVVSTEECEIHHSSDVSPYVEQRLWDDSDIPNHAKMTDAVHAHGALAAIELAHNGIESSNLYSRSIVVGPSPSPVPGYSPVQAAGLTKKEMRGIRQIYRAAAARAKRAGFDIIYVYSAHGLTLPTHFLSRKYNQRTDEYGGSLMNRCRFLREILEETIDEVRQDGCAIAVRMSVDETAGVNHIWVSEESLAVIEMLAELPDLWDVNLSTWENDSATSRFEPEGFQEQYIKDVKSLTSKPVVGVGRYTSPDAMVASIRNGIQDLIGAARPSIADPFLPRKIEEGRIDDIRECIGCNICVSGDFTMTPMRCTQNPTVGEEWRRGWHPEIIPSAGSSDSVLIVGAGPAGLECALALGRRGYQVTLAEGADEFGGRVARESRLPGLAAWRRVQDHRLLLLERMVNVNMYLQSSMDASSILEFGAERVVIATGAKWRNDGVGREYDFQISPSIQNAVLTPDDIMDGVLPNGRVVIFDDDHYYMGGVVAEALCRAGAGVEIITPAPDVSHWTHNTLEQNRIQARLMTIGVNIYAGTELVSATEDGASLRCVYTGAGSLYPLGRLVLVTSRIPSRELFDALDGDAQALQDAKIKSVDCIGDCRVPGTIAAAVYAGHLWARELDEAPVMNFDAPFRREHAVVEPD